MKLEMPDDWFSMIMDHQGYSDTSSHIYVYNSTSISIRSIRLCEYPRLCVTSHSKVVDWNCFFFGIFGQRLHDVDRLHSQFCSISFPLFATNVRTGAPRRSTVLSGVWVETPVWSLQPIWGLLGHSTDLENQFCGTSCDARLSRPVSLFFGGLETSQQQKGSFGFQFFF